VKVKTSKLTGSTLDWAVAQALGQKNIAVIGRGVFKLPGTLVDYKDGSFSACPFYTAAAKKAVFDCDKSPFYAETDWWEPSTSAAQGGPLLTEARISRTIEHSGLWIAYWTDGYGEGDDDRKCMQCDRSELVAGLRCLVALKFGDEIDIPEEAI